MLNRTIINLIGMAVLLLISTSGTSHSHSGRTDANGGHYNRKTGTYHYHNSGKSSSVTETKPIKYNRALYGGTRWRDFDKDGQDTRQEVLILESEIDVELSSDGKKVVSGRWYCPYTDRYFTSPDSLQIDHFIPLKETHISGGNLWDTVKRIRYANDLANTATLIAVYGRSNSSKGAREPGVSPKGWLPPNEEYRCEYIRTWVDLKMYWKLEMDKVERDFIKEFLENNCTEE